MNFLVAKKASQWISECQDEDVFVVMHCATPSRYDETFILGVYNDIELAKQCIAQRCGNGMSNVHMHVLRTKMNGLQQFKANKTNKCLICNGIGNKCPTWNKF